MMAIDSTNFTEVQFVFDEPRDIYYSGQVLSGHFECELRQPLNYSAITITFLGKANVEWTETEAEEYNGVSRVVTVNYAGNELYFNFTQCVSGGTGVVQMPPGRHKFPFQYQIPHTAPSSFSGERGYVTYSVIAHVVYPGGERNEYSKDFEVVAPMDLNRASDDVKAPINLEFEEVYSCCCSSNPLTLGIQLPASGYCPGQRIPISISADNESSVEIKTIIFEIVQRECYHAKQPASDYIPPDEVLETLRTGAILSNTKRDFTYEMVVPEMIAPNLQNCSIIDVGFFFKVTVKLSGCNDDLEDETELCIGLVPLAYSESEPYKHPMTDSLPQAAVPQHVNIPNETAVSYPNANAGYPVPTPGYPTSNPGYPNSNPGYPVPSPGYPVPTPGNPNSNPGYPIPSLGHPNSNPGYPIPSLGHPNSNPGYPTSNPGYPTSNPGYPTSNPGYPTPNVPYTNESKNSIPLSTLPNNQMGFVIHGTPGNTYPTANVSYGMGNSNASQYQTFSPSAPPS